MKKSVLFILFFACIFGVCAQKYKLKVSTFNMRYDNQQDAETGNGWQNRYPVIASMIEFHDLDIIGSQECKYNQLVNLKEALSDYDYIGRGRGKKEKDGEYAAIFYKTTRFKLLRSGNFWLSKTPQKPSKGWDAALNRICTWGKFEDKENKLQFFVFNLHMDHVGVEARKNSATLVVQKIKEIAGTSPVILTGDFNADQESESFKIFAQSGLLYDCYFGAPIIYNPNGTFNAFNIANTTSQRIDHVFVTQHFIPTRYGVLTDLYWTSKESERFNPADAPFELNVTEATPRFPSDHFPVVVELTYE